MPITTPLAMPDPPVTAGTATVPDGGWADGVWAWINGAVHSNGAIYGIAGTLALLLALSVRSRYRRAKAEAEETKAELTFTDRAITRVTGILATAVVALGAWKVFGDVLHLHPIFRGILFFFAEAQIIAAWRRIRRHIHRHAILGRGTRTIYAIAFGSATVAAFDASSPVEVLLRFFAAGVAAYMIVEELAEELDIYLMAHPEKRPKGSLPQYAGRIKWTVSIEGILVWLRLAQATEQTLADVERQRRVARFSRTAYRLDTLKEDGAAKWRIRWVRFRLRRQTEAANEHLHLATDQVLLGEVRAQLALLYGVEDGTSRKAVADLNPLKPNAPRAITAVPFMDTLTGQERDNLAGQLGVTLTRQLADVRPDTLSAAATDIKSDTGPPLAADIAPTTVPDIDQTVSTDIPADTAEAAVPDTTADTATEPGPDTLTTVVTGADRTARVARRRTPDRTPKWTKEQLKAFRLRDTRDDMTYPLIAREVGVSEKTVSRWFQKRDAAEQPSTQIPIPTFDLPKPSVIAGVNGYPHATPEEY